MVYRISNSNIFFLFFSLYLFILFYILWPFQLCFFLNIILASILAGYINVKPRLKYKEHDYQRITYVLNMKPTKCRICSDNIYFYCYECVQVSNKNVILTIFSFFFPFFYLFYYVISPENKPTNRLDIFIQLSLCTVDSVLNLIIFSTTIFYYILSIYSNNINQPQ